MNGTSQPMPPAPSAADIDRDMASWTREYDQNLEMLADMYRDDPAKLNEQYEFIKNAADGVHGPNLVPLAQFACLGLQNIVIKRLEELRAAHVERSTTGG